MRKLWLAPAILALVRRRGTRRVGPGRQRHRGRHPRHPRHRRRRLRERRAHARGLHVRDGHRPAVPARRATTPSPCARPVPTGLRSDPRGHATLAAGANVTVIAHLSEAGEPTLTPFVNDVSNTAAGQGRLIVRHTAAAPAVDVLAGGEPVFTDLTNPNEAKADLPAGTVSAAVALAGTTDPVIGPADVPVVEGQATIVYAVGSAEDGNLGVLVQTIDGLHSEPAAVNTGNSGLAA